MIERCVPKNEHKTMLTRYAHTFIILVGFCKNNKSTETEETYSKKGVKNGNGGTQYIHV